MKKKKNFLSDDVCSEPKRRDLKPVDLWYCSLTSLGGVAHTVKTAVRGSSVLSCGLALGPCSRASEWH